MGGKVGQIGFILFAVKALVVRDRGWISRRMVLNLLLDTLTSICVSF